MSKAGYTFIEIMVAIAIFTILLGYAVHIMRGVSDDDRIKAATNDVAAVLRRARNDAFNGVVDVYSQAYPLGGYGVLLSTNSSPDQYVMFSDRNDNGTLDEAAPSEKFAGYKLNDRLNFIFGDEEIISQLLVRFNKEQPIEFIDVQEQGSNCTGGICYLANKKVTIGASSTACQGVITVSADNEPLYIETSFNNC